MYRPGTTDLLAADAPPAHELARAIAAGAISPVDVVARALARAEEGQPASDCFTAIWSDALDAAAKAAAAVARTVTSSVRCTACPSRGGRRTRLPRPTDHRPRRCPHGDTSSDMTAVFDMVAPCPAVCVSCGTHTRAADAGLPIGLQAVGRRWHEDTVLRVAGAVELTSRS